jgi:hypothetical protein
VRGRHWDAHRETEAMAEYYNIRRQDAKPSAIQVIEYSKTVVGTYSCYSLSLRPYKLTYSYPPSLQEMLLLLVLRMHFSDPLPNSYVESEYLEKKIPNM